MKIYDVKNCSTCRCHDEKYLKPRCLFCVILWNPITKLHDYSNWIKKPEKIFCNDCSTCRCFKNSVKPITDRNRGRHESSICFFCVITWNQLKEIYNYSNWIKKPEKIFCNDCSYLVHFSEYESKNDKYFCECPENISEEIISHDWLVKKLPTNI